MRVPAFGDASAGRMRLAVRFADDAATGRAAGGPIALPAGARFRLRTCVSGRILGEAPRTACSDRAVDTRGWPADGAAAAPDAALGLPRPAAGSGYLAALVEVDRINADGTRTMVATSWPRAGLPAAAVAVPGVGSDRAPLPRPQGLPLPGIEIGGVDSGAQDSLCFGTAAAGIAGAGTSTTELGTLPAQYEVGEPDGGGAPAGVMLLLHGGSWNLYGRGRLDSLRPEAARWRARGWRTVSSSYRPCAASAADVVALYDRVRATYGPSLPVCVLGQSAGGHLALLLAARRRGVACAIAEGGVADGPALAHQTAAGVAAPQTSGPRLVYNWMSAAFGEDALAAVSPTRLPVRARVLYGIAQRDWLVPWAQATEFAAAHPDTYVDAVRLAAGSLPWVHAPVSAGALADWDRRERDLVAPLTDP